MVYLVISSDEHPEWCTRMNENGIGPFGNMYVFYAMINVLSCVALVWWARSQYLAKTSGYYTPNAVVIFPVYVNVLVFTAITAIIQSVLFTSLYYVDITTGWMYYVAQGFMYGVYHIAIEGTTMLLLCRGIGRCAMIKSAVVGLTYGTFTWVCITVWFSSQSDQDENISEMTGNIIYYIWTLSQLVIYLAVWLLPNSGIFARRPAAIYWGRFLGLMRFGFTVCLVFNMFSLDFSFCLYHFLNGIVFCGFRVWVTYRTFFLDTLWWHGIAVEVPICYGANIPNNMEEPTGNGKPLEGVELSGDSALAMSSALDGFGRARGESLTREIDTQSTQSKDIEIKVEEPLVKEEKSEDIRKKRFSIKQALKRRSQRFSLTGKRFSSPGSRSPVPLLDFSHLEINTNKLLGVGSTARVYEGIWCGKKCAIKVLFTVEIVPEEIKRICLEASLLHSLQNVSNNVTRLFGIAMLPPSICVVMELCNEGSLNDVLYVKNAVDGRSRKSSSMRGSVVSNDRKWTLMMDQGNFSRTSMDKGLLLPTSDFKYNLPWEERLDLILGACEGLAAFAKVLPGYSHNDIKSANYLVHDVLSEIDTRSRAQSNYNTVRNTKKSFVVKLADLEFASIGETPDHLHRVGCVANWAAPEVLSNKHPVSPASDVFSLAMTMYEIVARDIPFSTENAAKNYLEGKRPDFPNLTFERPIEPTLVDSTNPSPPSSSLLPPALHVSTQPPGVSISASSYMKSSNLQNSVSSGSRPSNVVSQVSVTAESPITPQEITSRKMIEAIIVRAWSQEPCDRPDILRITDEVRLIAKEYKTDMDRMDNKRRATFKGNLIKNDSRAPSSKHHQGIECDTAIEMGSVHPHKSSTNI